ncbi:hypothetical protein WMY93_011629 [Mugilogobius chulae]|uniref:Bcr-Abl oncoprotein oligomerisation domain-containing protein n=1 Tax=Mugilogobius chulae TaxID=88201 RepID=A0AAW0P345_9GOBI
MWEQEEFAKHWKNEFPDCEVPLMDLNSVDDIECELESCKANLKRLQKALAEEKFKMIYLQTTISRQRRDDPERVDEPDRPSRLPEPVGVKVPIGALPAVLGSSFSRDRPRFSGKTGKPVPIPVPPRISSIQKPTTVLVNDNEDTKFLQRKSEDFKCRAGRQTTHRLSRDLDSGDDCRLSPLIQRRTSRGSGCSTPDRRSDGYLSSDHEDSLSEADREEEEEEEEAFCSIILCTPGTCAKGVNALSHT